jgi:hypothetical protein
MKVATRLSSPKSWHVVPGKACEQARPAGNGMIERPLNEFSSKSEPRLPELQNTAGCPVRIADRSAEYQTVPYWTDSLFTVFQALRARTSASSVESLPS